MGLGLFTVAGLAGAVFAIVHHIVVKTTLFLVGGLIEHAGGSSRLHRLGGHGRTAPARRRAVPAPGAQPGRHPAVLRLRRQVRRCSTPPPRRASGRSSPSPSLVSLLTLFSMFKIWIAVFWSPAADAPTGRRAADSDDAHSPAARALMVRADGRARRPRRSLIGVAAGPLYDLSDRAAADLVDPSAYRRGGARAVRARRRTSSGWPSIWVLLWGSASPANVLGGLLVGGAARAASSPACAAPRPASVRVRPLAIARLVGHVLVARRCASNVVLTREVLSPRHAHPHRRRRRAAARLLRRAAHADLQPLALTPGHDAARARPGPDRAVRPRAPPRRRRGRCAATSCASPTSPCGPSARPRPSPPRTRYLRRREAARDRRRLRRAVGWPPRCSSTACCAGRRSPTGSSASTGCIVAGICLIIVRPWTPASGAFLPAAVVLALVSFISTSVIARFIEGRGE